MVKSSRRSKRTIHGTKYHTDRKKRKKELSNPAALTRINGKKIKKVRKLGGNIKKILLSHNEIIIKKGNKNVKAKIIRVLKNPANRHFVRMNVLTKGAIVETDKGNVKITNRPGQQAHIQGIITE